MNVFENYESTIFVEQPYQTFISPINGDINLKFLSQYKNNLLILNFSSEHWNGTDIQVYQKLVKTNINFLMLTSDHTHHQKFSRLFYYPYWYLECLARMQQPVEKNKIFALGILNGFNTVTRTLNHIELNRKTYIDKISIGNFFSDSPKGRIDDPIKLTSQEKHLWSSLPKKVVAPEKIMWWDLNLPQLTETYFHLVVESTILPKVFITEKTWKPIACQTPFLIYANPGLIQFLAEQGVDTYEDVIDHRYYDNEVDPRQRLKKLHQVLDNLMFVGTDNIYKNLYTRMTSNRHKFFNREFFKDYLQQIDHAVEKFS